MNDEERKILEFLLNTDFNVESGFSYTQLINFLNDYRKLYKMLLENRELYKYELEKMNKIIVELQKKEEKSKTVLERKEEQIQNLLKLVSRKLTWSERFFGRFKFKK